METKLRIYTQLNNSTAKKKKLMAGMEGQGV